MPDVSKVSLEVWGDYACFTRPEMKVERVSYDVMTPSAARGILEAILWKPAIRWDVRQIDVLKPIGWTSVRRNEVGGVVPTRGLSSIHTSGEAFGLNIEDNRQQRAALLLRDVAYRIHARFHMTAEAGSEENPIKFVRMFERRVEKGQCFFQPYLGCREFSAFFGPMDASGESDPIGEDRELGWMLHDFEHHEEGVTPRFFRASLDQGTMHVPEWGDPEVRA